jgi:hypothetical protein
MMADPDRSSLRALWALYLQGDWVAVAMILNQWDGALWDLTGVSCNCTFREARRNER